MEQLFRVFLLEELHGWTHETALVEYLQQFPEICERLGLETIPDQSTLWRTWNQRFMADLRETIQTAARMIFLKAVDAGVTVPREPDCAFQERDEEPSLDDQTILDRSEEITTSVSRDIYPAFSLDRGESCEIHENAFWDLQTYPASVRI